MANQRVSSNVRIEPLHRRQACLCSRRGAGGLLLGSWLGALACGGEPADASPSFAASVAGAGAAATAAAGSGAGGQGDASTAAGAGGAGAGGDSGAGGSAGSAPLSGVARAGAETCPPGPWGSPLPASPNIRHLASVGGSGSFNWEGVVWTGSALLFSEIASDDGSQIDRFSIGGSVERGVFANTGSNGLALDAGGNLLLAAHDVGGISRLALPAGVLTRGSQSFNGLRFNSPNDLVLRGDGNLYFTDPDFQSPSGRIQGVTRVYRIAPAPAGQAPVISVVDDSIDQPNGITLSPDGNRLYVSGGSILRSYALDAGGAPTVIKTFQQALQVPDGMAMDCAGNVYAVENQARRVRVFSPDGDLLGTLGPQGFDAQALTNAAFGGPERTTLFISGVTQDTRGGLYSVELSVPGLPY